MAKKRYVFIRRQWNDWRIAKVEFSKIKNLHWSHYRGEVHTPCPQTFSMASFRFHLISDRLKLYYGRLSETIIILYTRFPQFLIVLINGSTSLRAERRLGTFQSTTITYHHTKARLKPVKVKLT